MNKFTIDPNNNCAILEHGRHYEQLSNEVNAEDYCRLLNLERKKKLLIKRDCVQIKKTELEFLFRQLKIRQEFQDNNEIFRIENNLKEELV